ncbi:hypothetical protein BJ875DRAFT_509607 [Amylocarpus encephaloides]|uniref:Uncharacterized protein n=1 Tax=Amylocarpus encephaloides TaxID=45428 RepID=A0A9P8C596_9HELO|nr:hypothetical protein BJ875DRAFT_509607 [Amylocarpus encephaloides]
MDRKRLAEVALAGLGDASEQDRKTARAKAYLKGQLDKSVVDEARLKAEWEQQQTRSTALRELISRDLEAEIECVSTVTSTQTVISTVTVYGSSTLSIDINSGVAYSHIHSYPTNATSGNSGATASYGPSISSLLPGTGYFPNTASTSTFATQGTGSLSLVIASTQISESTRLKTSIPSTNGGSSSPSTTSNGENSGASTSVKISVSSRLTIEATLMTSGTWLTEEGTSTASSYSHLSSPVSSESKTTTSGNSSESTSVASSIIPTLASKSPASSSITLETTSRPYASISSTRTVGGNPGTTTSESSFSSTPTEISALATSSSTLSTSAQTTPAISKHLADIHTIA